MLTCYGHEVRLPQSDLAYLAFRLAVEETLSDIELYRDLEEEPEYPAGYLAEVPFLEQVSLQVQVDLLAETWSRHQRPELVEASLLDAAIVYAVCHTAARIIEDLPEVVAAYLQDGPRSLNPRIRRRATHRLEAMFETFWDDDDFLLIDEWADLPPDQAAESKACPLVCDIGVTDAEDFECSYEDWVTHFRDAVRCASDERKQSRQEVCWTGEMMKQVQLAITAGLDDGTRIERQQDGWVVIDRHEFYLMDPEDAAWVADADDEDMPAAVFDSPEDAYVAYLRSCAVGDAREQRREDAMKRLGRA